MPDDPNAAPISDPTTAFQNLLKKKDGDALSLASQLFDENFQLREQKREMKGELPKDGDITLTGDDAKEWEAFKALNVKAADAKKAIETLPTLEKQNKELAGMEHLREIADLGIDGSKLNLNVLKDQLARFPDAVISFKTEKDKDGNEAKVAYIKAKADAAETAFSQFATDNLADYLPSLKVSTEANTPAPNGNTPDPKPKGGAATLFDRIRENVKNESEAAAKPSDMDSRFGRSAIAA
jgi:hypothetical protein